MSQLTTLRGGVRGADSEMEGADSETVTEVRGGVKYLDCLQSVDWIRALKDKQGELLLDEKDQSDSRPRT